MKNPVIARNYAEALLAVARNVDAVERFAGLLDVVAGVTASDPVVHGVLMSPRVTKAAKAELFAAALKGVAPEPFIRFLGAVVRRGRQGMLPEISAAYQDQVDLHFNRVHASVVTARDVDAKLGTFIAERLTAAAGKTVLPHYRTDPAIVGGVVVRVGDRVFDGSIRRRLQKLKYRMLHSRSEGS